MRLHPGPFDAEAVMRHPDLLQGGQILVEITPCVEGIPDDGSLLLIDEQIPVADIVILISRLLRPVLVLETTCGDTPGKGGVASQLRRLVLRCLIEWTKRMNRATREEDR